MAFLVTVYLISITIISYTAEMGSSLSSTPWQLSADKDHSCPSVEEQNRALLQIQNNISDVIAELKTIPQCGEGFWYRVAYLNMTDSMQVCPSNWVEISTPVRTCGRPSSAVASCPGVKFSARSLQYSKVCGRVIGYQDGSPDAFYAGQSSSSPDDIYVDGVSLTHGTSRTHIWTFAVGGTDGRLRVHDVDCPCAHPTASSNILPPSYVGDNYFCESGNTGQRLGGSTNFFEEDPVWDGQQCEGECCSNGKSPPWFRAILPNATSDDIEIRICGNEGTNNEDTPVQMFEIYVQ